VRTVLKKHPYIYQMARRSFHFLRALGKLCLKGDVNYFRCFLSSQLKMKNSMGKPILLNIEPANICNLKCPVCETGCGILGREPAVMGFERFCRILDQFDKSLKIINLYFMGEAFLNKDIYEIIRYAANRGLYASTCTNGETVDVEKLVKSGLADVSFQIGGVTHDVHNIYRINGDLEKTLENVKRLVKYRDEHLQENKREKYPLHISLGFILMKHNEHQVDDFQKKAKELGVDSFSVIDPCVRNVDQAREMLPSDKDHWIYDDVALTKGKLKMKTPSLNTCEWIYSTVTVQVNGDVVPCCRDVSGKIILGNVFEKHITEIWNGEAYQRFRKKIARDQSHMDLCKLCEGYSMPFIPKK